MPTADPVPLKLTEEEVAKLSRDNGEPEWLEKQRREAFKAFRRLPLEASEIFKKYADVSGVNWQSFTTAEGRREIPEALDFIAKDDGVDFLQADGATVKASLNGSAKGIVLEDWHTALDRHADLAKKALLECNPGSGKFQAINLAAFNSGFLLYAPEGTQAEKPIRIASLVSGPQSLNAGLGVVVAGNNSSFSVAYERYSSVGGAQALSTDFTQVFAGDGAQVTVSGIQACDENTVSIQGRTAKVGRDSRLSSSEAHLGGFLAISQADAVLQGDGASSEDYQLVFGSASQRFTTTSNLYHAARNTSGKVAARSAFKDAARGLFKGIIDIGGNARGASAYLSGHAILLGRNASADAIPALKIENNEVRATHSASVSQLDEEKIFYLTTRGLAEDGARKLVVRGFLEPVLRQVREPSARMRVNALVGLKLDGKAMDKMGEAFKTSEEEGFRNREPEGELFERHYKYR